MRWSRISSDSEKKSGAVHERRLVLDANILIRATLGRGVGGLIRGYAADASLFAPDTAFLDTEEYFPRLAAKAGLSLDQAITAYSRLGSLVQALPQSDYDEYQAEAHARIARRDPEDWTVIACALVLDYPIWTEDRDFFGAGVATWTSDRVEIYLADRFAANGRLPAEATPAP